MYGISKLALTSVIGTANVFSFVIPFLLKSSRKILPVDLSGKTTQILISFLVLSFLVKYSKSWIKHLAPLTIPEIGNYSYSIFKYT